MTNQRDREDDDDDNDDDDDDDDNEDEGERQRVDVLQNIEKRIITHNLASTLDGSKTCVTTGICDVAPFNYSHCVRCHTSYTTILAHVRHTVTLLHCHASVTLLVNQSDTLLTVPQHTYKLVGLIFRRLIKFVHIRKFLSFLFPS